MDFLTYIISGIITVNWIFSFDIPFLSKIMICIFMVFPTIIVGAIINNTLHELFNKNANM